MTPLFFGIALSFVGSLPPGLINLTVAQTAIAKGLKPALWVTAGAAFAEFFQAIFAVVFTDWFLANPLAETAFRWVSVPLFWGLATHFFYFAKPPESQPTQIKISGGHLFKGLIISAFNLLAIPYWVFYCAWLKLEGWLGIGFFQTMIFALGVSLGTFSALFLFAKMGEKFHKNPGRLSALSNKAIGFIFLTLGFWQLGRIMFFQNR